MKTFLLLVASTHASAGRAHMKLPCHLLAVVSAACLFHLKGCSASLTANGKSSCYFSCKRPQIRTISECGCKWKCKSESSRTTDNIHCQFTCWLTRVRGLRSCPPTRRADGDTRRAPEGSESLHSAGAVYHHHHWS